MTKECKQQYTLRITQANATQLVVILYEMLLDYLEEGRIALEEGKKDESVAAIRKARGCMNELMNSLHLEYEPAPTLLQLYVYCIKKLAKYEYKQDLQLLEEIKKVISPLHDAYKEIEMQNTEGPVMNNSQSVYVGLTYGKNTLTENMADQGANRGMLA